MSFTQFGSCLHRARLWSIPCTFCACDDNQPALENKSVIKTKPRWPIMGLGSVEFKAKLVELQIQFRVQRGLLEPRQNLHVEGGGFMDLGSELKVIGEISI